MEIQQGQSHPSPNNKTVDWATISPFLFLMKQNQNQRALLPILASWEALPGSQLTPDRQCPTAACSWKFRDNFQGISSSAPTVQRQPSQPHDIFIEHVQRERPTWRHSGSKCQIQRQLLSTAGAPSHKWYMCESSDRWAPETRKTRWEDRTLLRLAKD